MVHIFIQWLFGLAAVVGGLTAGTLAVRFIVKFGEAIFIVGMCLASVGALLWGATVDIWKLGAVLVQ